MKCETTASMAELQCACLESGRTGFKCKTGNI